MSDLTVVALKNNLFADYREHEVKQKIIARIHELNLQHPKYKLDSEFLTFLTNAIEHLVQKKDHVDKKKLAIEIMVDLFGISDDEKQLIARNIEYLHSNKVIKRMSWYKLFRTGMKEWFRKKWSA